MKRLEEELYRGTFGTDKGEGISWTATKEANMYCVWREVVKESEFIGRWLVSFEEQRGRAIEHAVINQAIEKEKGWDGKFIHCVLGPEPEKPKSKRRTRKKVAKPDPKSIVDATEIARQQGD